MTSYNMEVSSVTQKGDRTVAIFIPTLGGGGAERVMLLLAEGFNTLGFDVDVVVACRAENDRYEVPETIRVVKLAAPRVLRALPRLVDYLREEQPFGLVSAVSHANIVALWAKRIAGVNTRVVVTEHGLRPNEFSTIRNWKEMVTHGLIKHLYGSAHSVVAVSNGLADSLSERMGFPRRLIRVIYNPVITEDLHTKAKAHLDHPWLISQEPPVILGVGRLTTQKDFPTLLRAFSKILSRLQARLIILGEGEDRLMLESLAHELNISEYLWLPGFVSNPYAYMSRSAVFALSSLWEGFGNVLVESMMCGCPVVSTDCPSGPSEILDRGKYGILVPPGEPQRLADAIVRILTVGGPVPDRSWLRQFTIEEATDKYVSLLYDDLRTVSE